MPEGRIQPITMSEISGGAKTKDVLNALAEVALISSGVNSEKREAIIKSETEKIFLTMNRLPTGSVALLVI